MSRLVHRRHGPPAEVLEWAPSPPAVALSGDAASVRVTHVPIHPGDLLGVSGSPAFGIPATIPDGGRVPGFEGAGVIEALGSHVDPKLELDVGTRVAFFPVDGAWSERIVTPARVLVRIPDDVPDGVAAQMLINTVTASMILRAGLAALPAEKRSGVTIIQTGAGSAVGRLVTTLLAEAGVSAIRLVRSRSGAAALRATSPSVPVVATEDQDWMDQVRDAVGEREPLVALDGVGGDLLAGIARVLSDGGTVVSYGSLGGGRADIRLFAPRALTLRGVSIGRWGAEPAGVREADVATALRLARTAPALFDVAQTYAARDVAAAVEHAGRRGRSGTVLLTF